MPTLPRRHALLLALALAPHAVHASEAQFDIDAPTLSGALLAFSEQSGVQHLYTEPAIADRPGVRVTGRMQAREALDHLLADTGLGYEFTDANTVRVFPAATGAVDAGNGAGTASGVRAPRAEPEPQSQGGGEPPRAGTLKRTETVVVTARKREELPEEIPLSLTVFTGIDVEQAGMQSIKDVADFTPNFSFRESFGRTFDRPVIRGMSNVLGAPNAGIFIDGVFLSGSINSVGLENIERIEVIKGPQAALYGRSTFAGAINYITRAPGEDFEANATATLAEHGEEDVSFRVSGPTGVDGLYFLLGGRYYDYEGTYPNVGTGGSDGIGAENTRTLNTGLRWAPHEGLESTLRYTHSRDDDGHIAFRLQTNDYNNCFLATQRGYYCGQVRRYDDVALNLDVLPDPGLARTSDRVSLSTDLGLLGGTLSSITAWTRERTETQRDNDFLNSRLNASVVFRNPNLFRTFDVSKLDYRSQELRWSSDAGQPLRWMMGGYWYDEKITGVSASGNAFFTGRAATAPSEVENLAVFGSIDYDVSERLTTSLEVRFAQDEVSTTTTSRIGGVTRVTDLSETFESFTPRVILEYSLGEGDMVYANVAKGNKPGGFNTSLQDANIPDSERARLAQFETFDEEYAWNYELGWKGLAFDNRVLFSAAAFHIDWDKQQLSTSEAVARTGTPFSTVPLIVNAGKTRVRGYEFSVDAQVMDGWRMILGVGRADARFVRYEDPEALQLFGVASVAGRRTPNAPEYTGSFSNVFTQPVGADWTASFRADYLYESTRYDQVFNLAETGISRKVNLRLTLERDDLTLALYGRNVTGNDTPYSVTRFLDPYTSLRRRAFGIALPRERQYGVTLGWRFN